MDDLERGGAELEEDHPAAENPGQSQAHTGPREGDPELSGAARGLVVEVRHAAECEEGDPLDELAVGVRNQGVSEFMGQDGAEEGQAGDHGHSPSENGARHQLRHAVRQQIRHQGEDEHPGVVDLHHDAGDPA